MSNADARRLVPGDPEFPERFTEIAPPASAIWVRGADLRDTGPRVAIVGSRAPTPYGVAVARSFAADLADHGICVVSGLARGIDAAAHLGALDAGGVTVAVVGCGPDVVHPRSNLALHDRILGNGTTVSEYEPGTPPLRHHFPARNRLIAALCRAVVVVQATHRSGALVTARWAAEYGVEVLAVPGDIRSPSSDGPHALLADGAHLCTRARDVVDVISSGGRDPTAVAPTAAEPVGLSDVDRRIWRALQVDGSVSADTCALAAGLPAAEALRALARLESLGHAIRTPSGTYQRFARTRRRGDAPIDLVPPHPYLGDV